MICRVRGADSCPSTLRRHHWALPPMTVWALSPSEPCAFVEALALHCVHLQPWSARGAAALPLVPPCSRRSEPGGELPDLRTAPALHTYLLAFHTACRPFQEPPARFPPAPIPLPPPLLHPSLSSLPLPLASHHGPARQPSSRPRLPAGAAAGGAATAGWQAGAVHAGRGGPPLHTARRLDRG